MSPGRCSQILLQPLQRRLGLQVAWLPQQHSGGEKGNNGLFGRSGSAMRCQGGQALAVVSSA